MTDAPPDLLARLAASIGVDLPTVRSRARAAGISKEAMEQHLADGLVRLDGEVVTDLDQPAPEGTRWHIAGR